MVGASGAAQARSVTREGAALGEGGAARSRGALRAPAGGWPFKPGATQEPDFVTLRRTSG
jgi:hypothetical protein